MAQEMVRRRFNPFAELDALQKQVFGDDFFTEFRGVSLPTTDVYTNDDGRMVVEMHLPNFAESDVSVDIDDGVLIVRGQQQSRDEQDAEGGKRYMVRESSSSFYRRIALPDRADLGAVTADFDQGVLTVNVPLKEVATPKKVAITVGSKSAASEDASTPEASAQPTKTTKAARTTKSTRATKAAKQEKTKK